MGNKLFDLPRHKRPLWEVLAFAAILLGLVALATRTSAKKFVAGKAAETPTATAGFAE